MSLTKPITPVMPKLRGIPYCHCGLRNGNKREVSYIPKKFAVVGEIIKIKQEDGSWEDGWVVESVGTEVDESFLDVLRAMWKGHRKVSDI